MFLAFLFAGMRIEGSGQSKDALFFRHEESQSVNKNVPLPFCIQVRFIEMVIQRSHIGMPYIIQKKGRIQSAEKSCLESKRSS